MLRFEWNALRIGDGVHVHDPRAADMSLIDGVVASVDAHKGANGVSIRVGGTASKTAVLWPSPVAVHAGSGEPSQSCWRCQELALT